MRQKKKNILYMGIFFCYNNGNKIYFRGKVMKRILCKRAVCTALAAATLLSAGTLCASAEEAPQENTLPAAYSSRDLGYVTSVKSQHYSSCWAFASMATLESALLRSGYAAEDMSTDHLNMWATTRSDGTGWQRSVATDGYPYIALGYLTSWQGGVFASEVPDLSIFHPVSGDELPTGLAHYGVTSVRYLTKDEPDVIKRCVMDYGGVYVSYGHNGSFLSADKTAYFMPPDFSGSYSGHSIELVGWDDNYPRENFNPNNALPQNNGAWLLKNSWGNNNELGGYFWVSYEDKYLLAGNYKPTYCLTGLEKLDGTKKLLQNEIYGATYEFRYIESKALTYMNRFTLDPDYDVIDKVIFKTESKGAAYSIYFVPDTAESTPDSDQSRWTKLYDGTVDYSGYLCADIDDYLCTAQTGSIAITIDASQTDNNSSIGVCEWLQSSGGNFIFINSSERGQSYLAQNGSVQDLMDYYKEKENDDIGGTFVIKAVTAKNTAPSLSGDANRDGLVNINDVTEIQRHIAEHTTLRGTAALNADVNGDGVISIEDATALQRILAEY